MSEYKPKPIDTSAIELSSDLIELSEELARNTHEVWAQQRLEQGWSYGPERDDSKKETPCLVPYEELEESEKVFDRNTSLETIKVLLALGYTIEKRN